MIKLLRNYLFLTLASLSITKADDIFKGVKGPTNFQVDERITYSKNNKNIETITNNLILKYWDGDSTDTGKWAFINFPYRLATFPNTNKGFGDVTFGLGPRGKIDNFHWFLYGALTMANGDQELSNNRYDIKAGTLVTYLTEDKEFEIDSALEYNITGRNDKGVNHSNEIYYGVLVGGKINDKIRAINGLISLIKYNGDFILNSRSVFRYTFSPTIHLEIIGDLSLANKNIPKSKSLGLFLRYNF